MSAAPSSTRIAGARPVRQEQPAPVAGLGIAILLVSLLPYLCGYLLAPPNQSFVGALNNIGDLSQYLAAIRQGSTGAWRYTNQFMPDHARPLLMYFPYLLAGHFSFGRSPALIYQILRLACGALALVSLAEFSRLYVGAFAARAAWLFLLLAGGLYWLALPLRGLGITLIDPSALTAPELNPLIAILISPHESLGLAAEIAGFTFLLRAAGATGPLWLGYRRRETQPSETRLVFAAMLAFLVLALSYPFLLPTVGLVGLAQAIVASRSAWNVRRSSAAPKRQLRASGILMVEMRRLVIALAPAGLIGLYYLVIFHSDPQWSQSSLAHVARPEIVVLLFAFGPLAFTAYHGARHLRAIREMSADTVPVAWAWFPLIWALVNACTLLLPVWQQGRQELGLTVPLALVSCLALAGKNTELLHGRVSLRPGPATALAFSAPLLLALYTAVAAEGVNPEYYVPRSVQETVEWLGMHAEASDVVLANARTGNLVPITCACQVVIGQNFQSFQWERRQAEVFAFYKASSQGAAQRALNVLRGEHVTFFLYGPFERTMGGHFNPFTLQGWHLRYHTRDNDSAVFALHA